MDDVMEQPEKPSFDAPEHGNYTMSEYDLALHPQITGNPANVPKHIMKDILWEVGFDTRRYTYMTAKCTHITLQGKRKKGLLFIGKERSDDEWLNSGMASNTGYIEAEWDNELRRDLYRMNR